MLDIKIQKIRDNAILPKYAHGTEDTGADLFISNIKALNNKGEFEEIKNPDGYSIAPFKTVLCGVGFKIAGPIGYDIQIRPTSGNSLRTPLRIPNSPATIDSGFRGEVAAIIQNVSDKYYKIKIGDKIAQMVIAKVEHANFIESDTLEASVRGDDGYGSTGIAGESEKGTEKPKKLFKDDVDNLNEVKVEEVKPRYNIGDEVILRNDLKPNTIYGGVKFVGSMNALKNNIIKIDSIDKRRFGRCIYNIADGWHLSEEMIDHEKTEEFIKSTKFDLSELLLTMLLDKLL
ncbi:dUTP diphosphatase [Peptostreptococcus stomatis]|jgi:dUTP pyrophosphatase|uniref:dUTP diphosphatase n=1 Tax=Peptostreptococcus stomatis TaxID=341694 RepID=UPI0024A9FDA4|nr:dUTP diphosphatase [Peptostreptococcus stomatis]